MRHHNTCGEHAPLRGARWNSPGREAIYASDTYAGAILEVLAHALRPRTLPGPHHAVQIDIPGHLLEALEPDRLPGWDKPESPEARQFGDRWLSEERTVVLSVPSVPARPLGQTLVINPRHAHAAALEVSNPFPVPWDDRLF